MTHIRPKSDRRKETGLGIEPTGLTGFYKNMPRGIIAQVFRCKITGGELTTNDEVTGFRWVTDADIAHFADEAYAIRVLDATVISTAHRMHRPGGPPSSASIVRLAPTASRATVRAVATR